MDAVEEAIRSLEQFGINSNLENLKSGKADPGEFVQQQYRERPSISIPVPRVFMAKAESVPLRQALSASISSLPNEVPKSIWTLKSSI